ncbi:hypothetical protein [Cellulosimicrobium cellulans]|uniref:hypothetical protein n=1 Tax=Cellulosimicrobium cellulans TaxID=1710 RepID=UPI0024072440|nr:hypothetical protein [Cellulosimicrobium cellulans]MDF9875805.1 hypothetical protein [Cellulosimicrobium cellulans]
MSRTIAYGNGWITGVDPAPPAVSITASLTAIRESPWQARDELEAGELRCGVAGSPPAHLTVLDGHIRIPLSPQLVEFYSYARYWRHSVLLNNVIDPDDFLDHLTDPRLDLPGVLRYEFASPAVLVDAHGEALDPARCALFWLDTLSGAVYNRAYFVFDPPGHSRTVGGTSGEPEVWGFESEHVHAPDLRSYLASLVADHADHADLTDTRTTGVRE